MLLYSSWIFMCVHTTYLYMYMLTHVHKCMRKYACIYVSTNASMQAGIHVLRVCIRACLHVCISAWKHVCTIVHVRPCMHARVRPWMHARVCPWTYAHVWNNLPSVSNSVCTFWHPQPKKAHGTYAPTNVFNHARWYRNVCKNNLPRSTSRNVPTGTNLQLLA